MCRLRKSVVPQILQSFGKTQQQTLSDTTILPLSLLPQQCKPEKGQSLLCDKGVKAIYLELILKRGRQHVGKDLQRYW